MDQKGKNQMNCLSRVHACSLMRGSHYTWEEEEEEEEEESNSAAIGTPASRHLDGCH